MHMYKDIHILEYKTDICRYQLNLIYRMIEYEGVAGTCLPHRDFGLLTLVQSTTSGLLVEREGRMVPVEGDVLLAGWCLHLLTNGRVPAPLHQVSAPPVKRYSCVTFMAPMKVKWRQ